MKVTHGKRGDYAVRAVLDIARHEQRQGPRRKTREIAEAMSIPPAFLPQILADLVRAGVLTAAAGQHGGYALARPAAAISLLDVMEAAEGELGLTACVLRDVPCSTNGYCEVHGAWRAAQDELRASLGHTNFEVLANTDTPPTAAPTGGARTGIGRRRN